ncbi:PREDICTED: red chlorophyll catabolite reductase, chloroplastic [Tarenaya hassleriana]|uniref:red chlorophyll catabolite reductase, chloroplastic n=1 Tax=Tarenaya hassleriana TaxID=28532 RepID=UPI00053C84D4|nr:PREDICTED: red chlorophyll catabolite reductase, chloroplastic [Tarenaya hassleriana]
MAVTFSHSLHSSTLSLLPSPSPLPRSPLTKPVRAQLKPMDHHDDLRRKFMEFPHVSSARRRLMTDLMSTMEDRLGSKLLPCTLPPDVRYFQNQGGNAEASLYIRSGEISSPIDFILGSWIHCKLPTGASLNITSMSGYLNSSTEAPNFVIELIQNSPTSLVIILDLPHRKDLVLYPDYLKTFYEDTRLDSHRQSLLNLAEVNPYTSPSLFVRSAFSPAAAILAVEAEEGRMDEILRDHVRSAALEVMGIWLDRCVEGEGREVGEKEKEELERRDKSFRRKTIEVDLASSFPMMFGEQLATRALSFIRDAFHV